MDFSGLVVIPLAAIITASWIVGVSLLSHRRPGFRVPFLVTYGLGVALMEPWRIAGWHEFGMVAIMLVMLALTVVAGCLIGGIPAVLIVSVGKKVRRLFGT